MSNVPRAADNILDLPPSRWVDVEGPVHYLEWGGPNEGPTFVCVHGFGGSVLNWALAAPGLARAGRVVAVDLAGFGETPLAGRRADVQSNRLLLDGFVRRLGLEPAVFVGNSMGGEVVLLQAATAPDTVRAMVLADALFPRDRIRAPHTDPRVIAAFTAMSAGRRFGRWAASSRARRLDAEQLVQQTLRMCTANPWSIDPAIVEAMVQLTQSRQANPDAAEAMAQAARSIVRDYIAPPSYRRLVEGIGRPALVIHGQQDRLVPVNFAQRATADHPNWDLVIFPDTGHIPMIEQPDRFVATVHEWLPRLANDKAPDQTGTDPANDATASVTE
jgi:pimeloyl-ACP methyl ester carboxylesterase